MPPYKSPRKLADRDLLIMAAEQVMGATRYIEKLEGWNPLVSIADAFMLVDAMEGKGFLFSMGRDSLQGQAGDWVVGFRRINGTGYVAADADRCRAILIAALKARGESQRSNSQEQKNED
jgi:hypothetical protein